MSEKKYGGTGKGFLLLIISYVTFIIIASYCKLRNVCSATYLLNPWSIVLLEKLTGFAASQEIPRIYGTRKFITVLTSARHISLS
jgi:hypothetical protein